MIHFKNNKDRELFCFLHPALIMIYADLANYAKNKHDIDLVVTQTITTEDQDKVLRRTSPSHRECRAIDIRTNNIDVFIVADLVDYINNKKQYEDYRYMSRSGVTRLAYYHVGSAEHIHLAIHARYAANLSDSAYKQLGQLLP